MAFDVATELKRAATTFAAKNGNAALRSMLAAVTGVEAVSEVPEADQLAALTALMNGQTRAAFSGKGERSNDHAAIWAKHNGAAAEERRNLLGATEIDPDRIWSKYNAAGRKVTS